MKKVLLLIMTVALVGCKKTDTAPLEENYTRGFEVKRDLDFENEENYVTKQTLTGVWERVAIQWVAGTWGASNFLVGPYKKAEALPNIQRWHFDGTSFKVSRMNPITGEFSFCRSGTMVPTNQPNTFKLVDRIPDNQFTQCKFRVVQNDGIKMKVKTIIKDHNNNLRARVWLTKL